MLRASALQFKPAKKRLFLKVFRLLGLPAIIDFHASDNEEAKDIRHHFGAKASITLIPNLPGASAEKSVFLEKKQGELSMIFVGRIHPIKNLDLLLRILALLPVSGANAGTGHILRLTIVGSREDDDYWEQCRQQILALPPSIRVDYLGEIPNDKIPELLEEHHIFALPTRGENFGHAIYESLSAGRPVLISDQTPWQQLSAARAGWELPLQDPTAFGAAIVQALGWDQKTFDQWSAGAFDLASKHRSETGALDKYRALFS